VTVENPICLVFSHCRPPNEGKLMAHFPVVEKLISGFLNTCPMKLFRYLERFSDKSTDYSENIVILVGGVTSALDK